MNKTYGLILFALSQSVSLLAQAFWTEGFNAGTSGWQLNVVTGAEGADPNFWRSDDYEGGRPADSCSVTNNGNATLYITSVFMPTGGATYDAGGLCALLYCPQTSRRAESPIIDCSGKSTIYLQFNYIEGGQDTLDNAMLYYKDGTNWTLLEDLPKTNTCNVLGLWTRKVVMLPASANNNPNVQIAFHWQNNDDGIGTNPSFAVDNICFSSDSSICFIPSAVDNITAFNPVTFFYQSYNTLSIGLDRSLPLNHAQLTIYDISGKVLKQHSITDYTVDIDCNEFAKSLYFFRINVDKYSYTQKFVIR